LLNQVSHGPSIPQRGRDILLLRCLGVQNLLDVLSLGVGEHAPGAQRTSGSFAGQGVESAGGVGRPPAADGFAGDAEEFAELGLGVAEFATVQRPEAERVENIVGQLMRIG